VEFLELGTSAAFFVALEYLDVVFQFELFEEPDDSLGARLLEPESLRLAHISMLVTIIGICYMKPLGATGVGVVRRLSRATYQ